MERKFTVKYNKETGEYELTVELDDGATGYMATPYPHIVIYEIADVIGEMDTEKRNEH